MTPTAFSIATPTRNALDKLRRCVGSVRGQSGIALEHHVQDACSTDGTVGWLAAQSSQQGMLITASEADRGMYDAINRAWARSRGRILSWLNSDEQYLPGTLERVQSCFDAHPEIDAVFGDYLVVDAHGRAVAVRREIPLRRFYVANTFLNAQTCTLFYRRELLDRGLLRLNDRLRYAADKDMVLRLLEAGVRFRHIPEVLSLFGVDGTNLSTHGQMAVEAEAVRIAHGGLRWRPLRSMAYAGRRVERWWSGAYRASDLDYCYALDEVPHYAEYRARRIGGRYSLANTAGCAERLGAAGSQASAPIGNQENSA